MRAGRSIPEWRVVAASLLALLGPWSEPARAQGQGAASVWYRSATGCPDAGEFMQALQARDVDARLAQVGDAIDFVVTLGVGPDGKSSGVLERQTQTGTVAIRRVDDASCAQVADALALTLALAVAGATDAAGGEPAGSLPTTTPASTAVTPSSLAASAPAAAAAQPRVAGDSRVPELRSAARWSLGLAGTATTGVAPDLLPGGSAFVEVDWGGGDLLHPALRIAALLAFGSSSELGSELELRMLGGRLEGCPVSLAGGAFAASPCLAVEIAQLHSSGGGTGGSGDSGLWVASEAAARLRWAVSPRLAIEAQLGALLPWTRYTVQRASDRAVLHRTADVGMVARIGAVPAARTRAPIKRRRARSRRAKCARTSATTPSSRHRATTPSARAWPSAARAPPSGTGTAIGTSPRNGWIARRRNPSMAARVSG